MIDTIDSRAGVCAIRVDERDAACRATRHLLQHGYRDIGIFIGPLTMLNAQDRLNGWRDALQEAGIAPRDEWIFEVPYTRRGGYEPPSARCKAHARAPFSPLTSSRRSAACRRWRSMGCARRTIWR